ncbi:hypothetical protein ACFX2I_008901 [Malus domestica]
MGQSQARRAEKGWSIRYLQRVRGGLGWPLLHLQPIVSIPISPTTSTKHARIYPVRSATLSTVKHPLKLQCFKDPFTVYTCDSCDQPCRIAYTCSDCELNLDVKCASNWRLILEDRRHVHQFTVLRKKITFDCDIGGGTWDHVSMPIRGNSFVKSAIQTLIVAALFITVVGVVTLLTLCAFEEITDTFDDDNADDDDDRIPGQKQWNTVDDHRESAAAQQIKHFSHDQHLLVLSDALRDLDCTNYL